jgi:hypothetical protein
MQNQAEEAGVMSLRDLQVYLKVRNNILKQTWPPPSKFLLIRNNHRRQRLRIRLCGLFQFRITSEIINLFRHLAGLLGWVISPSQGLFLHRTAQNRKTRTNIDGLDGIRTCDPSIQAAKTHALDQSATEIGGHNYSCR